MVTCHHHIPSFPPPLPPQTWRRYTTDKTPASATAPIPTSTSYPILPYPILPYPILSDPILYLFLNYSLETIYRLCCKIMERKVKPVYILQLVVCVKSKKEEKKKKKKRATLGYPAFSNPLPGAFRSHIHIVKQGSLVSWASAFYICMHVHLEHILGESDFCRREGKSGRINIRLTWRISIWEGNIIQHLE